MSEAARSILIVDCNQRNLRLLALVLQKAEYPVLIASEAAQISQALEGNQPIGLALVDIAGFDRTIWQYCEQMRAKEIPMIVISPRQSATIQQESLLHGALGTLVKPLVINDLLALIRSLVN